MVGMAQRRERAQRVVFTLLPDRLSVYGLVLLSFCVLFPPNSKKQLLVTTERAGQPSELNRGAH